MGPIKAGEESSAPIKSYEDRGAGSPAALVTGANKGLGKRVARDLAACGMRVYLGSRDLARGEAAAAELAADGLDVAALQLDVTDDVSVAAAVKRLSLHHERLDVLVNNAGQLFRTPALETDVANMRATFEPNVFGIVRVIHETLPLLQRAERPRIVNVASTSASLTLASDSSSMFSQSDTSLAYSASKAAVTMLTVHYANAFRRSPAHAHILINAATPGYIATDLNNHAGTRTVAEGATIVVSLATLPQEGPNGGFFSDEGPVPW